MQRPHSQLSSPRNFTLFIATLRVTYVQFEKQTNSASEIRLRRMTHTVIACTRRVTASQMLLPTRSGCRC